MFFERWLIIFGRIFFTPIGVFYRWVFFVGTKPYKYLEEQGQYLNNSIGVIVTFVILVIIKYYRTKH